MDLGVITGAAILATTAPIALVVFAFAWKNRRLPGVRPFLVMLALALWWATAEMAEMVSADLGAKLIWVNLQFVPITLLPVAWLIMTLDYTHKGRSASVLRVTTLCVIPVVTNVLLWTGQNGHLMRTASWLDSSGSYPVISQAWGPWFWVHTSYSYLLLGSALTLLLTTLLTTPPLHRRRVYALLFAGLISVAASILDTSVPSSSAIDDFTAGFFILAGLLLTWGLLRVRLFSVVSIARHALVEDMRDGVLVLDDAGRVIDLNESARKLIDRPATEILDRPLVECWNAWEQIAALYSAGADQAELRLECEGSDRHYEVRSSPVAQRGQLVAHLLVLTDITDRVLLEQSLRNQALTDGLTGLPNRVLFMSRLVETIHQARRREEVIFAVMVLDIDRFKLINDSLGHLAGDVLLQSVAAKLRRCVREVDTVARMGGDEFIILLHDISSQRDLLPILSRIREELRTPVYFKHHEMSAGSSIGVVIWDASYEDAEEIVRAADTAMYQAKEDGRDCCRVFDEKMHKAVLRSMNDETDLRTAIRERAFTLVYQPVVDLQDGRVHSLEALLRWQHPTKGTIFPRDFLAAAENSGLIVALGEIALDEVFSQMHQQRLTGQLFAELAIRVNVSPRQLTEPDFVTSVLSRLAAWQIPSDRLIIEITENVLIRDPPKARLAMKRLRGLGVRLCLDDFGAGRSSLQHLTTFPVQELKIDPTYVSGVAPGNRDQQVVRHLAALAHTLGLDVTAEGVERAEQWESLQEAGCDRVQGYYVASPMEVDVLTGFLKDLHLGTLPKEAFRTLLSEPTPSASPSTAHSLCRNSSPRGRSSL